MMALCPIMLGLLKFSLTCIQQVSLQTVKCLMCMIGSILESVFPHIAASSTSKEDHRVVCLAPNVKAWSIQANDTTVVKADQGQPPHF